MKLLREGITRLNRNTQSLRETQRQRKMMSLRLSTLHFTPSLTKPQPLLHLHSKTSFRSFSSTTSTYSSSSSPIKMSQTIEHIVLFKVKPDTPSTQITTMINGLNGLTSLDQVLHLSAGPIHKNRSSSFTFTHMLHSRYKTKDDLGNYSAHPSHLSVVRESVLPICEDIMAVDWVADLDEPIVVPASALMRLNFLKLKEGLGESEKGEVLKVIGGWKEKFKGIQQLSVGENFSPARAKGFSIASIAVFPGLNELEALDGNEEAVKEEKEKVKEFLESVIVLDYAVNSLQSASL